MAVRSIPHLLKHWPSSSEWSVADLFPKSRCYSQTRLRLSDPVRLSWRSETSGRRTADRTLCPPSSSWDRTTVCTTLLSDCRRAAQKSSRNGTGVCRASCRDVMLVLLNDCSCALAPLLQSRWCDLIESGDPVIIFIILTIRVCGSHTPQTLHSSWPVRFSNVKPWFSEIKSYSQTKMW